MTVTKTTLLAVTVTMMVRPLCSMRLRVWTEVTLNRRPISVFTWQVAITVLSARALSHVVIRPF